LSAQSESADAVPAKQMFATGPRKVECQDPNDTVAVVAVGLKISTVVFEQVKINTFHATTKAEWVLMVSQHFSYSVHTISIHKE